MHVQRVAAAALVTFCAVLYEFTGIGSFFSLGLFAGAAAGKLFLGGSFLVERLWIPRA